MDSNYVVVPKDALLRIIEFFRELGDEMDSLGKGAVKIAVVIDELASLLEEEV